MPPSWPTWLYLVPSVLALQIGAFVLVADRRTVLNRLVFLTSLAVSLWNLANFWEVISTPSEAVLWFRWGGIFLPVLSLHVLVAYRGHTDRAWQGCLAAGYLWAAVVAVTASRQMLIHSPADQSPPGLPPYVFSLDFAAFAVYAAVAVTLSGYLLAQELRAAQGRERLKVLLVALASAAAILSSAGCVLYYRGYPAHTLNALSTLVYLAALAWLVLRYRFGNANLFQRSSAVYSLALAFVTGLYVAGVVLLAFWLQTWRQWHPLVVTFFCVLVAGPLFYPLYEGVVALLRRFFPLPRDLYYAGLKHFLQEMNVLAPLPDLGAFLVARLASLFELSEVCLLVRPAKAPPFLLAASAGFGRPQVATLPFPEDDSLEPTLVHLRRHSGLPVVSMLPLSGRSRSVGLLAIGRHPDGGPLTAEEREVLEAFARQAGIALENADLYSELLAVKNHYLTVIQSTHNALLVVSPDGLVEDANRAATRLFGPLERLLGRPIEEATGQAALGPLVAQTTAAKEPLAGRELALPDADGHSAPYAVVASPLLDPQTGDSAGAVIALSDLSDIRAMQRQVERAERLAALGQLTAGLAHELRNGLNNIAGYATMALDELQSSGDPRQRYLEGILEDAAELESLLKRFLAFAREEPLSSTEVALPALVERVLGALMAELRTRHVLLVKHVDPAAPTVQGDPAQLAQALTNVLLNAIEAMGRGGGVLTLEVGRSAAEVEVRVRDTGPGIPPELQEQVFNPFFTTKAEGTGLGLPITHRIITRHGGRVRLDSHPGRGTTVTLSLPSAKSGETRQSQRRSG